MTKRRLGSAIVDKMSEVISFQTKEFRFHGSAHFRWSSSWSSWSSGKPTDIRRAHQSNNDPNRRYNPAKSAVCHDGITSTPSSSEIKKTHDTNCGLSQQEHNRANDQVRSERNRKCRGSFNESSRRLIEARLDHERQICRAARDYRQSDHYDHSLFGLSSDLDLAVARHQREAMHYNQDRHLKEEQAKLVAPNMRQSPIAIMTMNPTYELQNKPLIIEYPARVENLRLNNTGFAWEVKIPYQMSMATALHGAHLNQSHRYRLDQFHCHWGSDDNEGSEHTVDNKHYSAEMHFVHYNMEKYRTMSKAARHPDGLVVLGVFLEASDEYLNHAELEKIASHLKHVPLKGEHSIIRQAVHIENLLPQNRSYWSYQGSLTTPPYFESVTWFIFKHPIRCNTNQIQRFRGLRSSLRASDEGHYIDTNHRKTQPLNGRSIVNYDEQQTVRGNNNSSGSYINAPANGGSTTSS